MEGSPSEPHKFAIVTEMLGLGPLLAKLPSKASGGQLRRAALARALLAPHDLLLLDEPFAALDHATRSRVASELGGYLRGVGSTCVFVAHEIPSALILADHIVVLRGSPAQVSYVQRRKGPDAPWVRDGFETEKGIESVIAAAL